MLFTLIILGNVNVDVQRGGGGMTAKKSLCQNLSHCMYGGVAVVSQEIMKKTFIT